MTRQEPIEKTPKVVTIHAPPAVGKSPDGRIPIYDSPQLWIGSARQFKRLADLNRPIVEKETADRDFGSAEHSAYKDRPVPLDGFDTFLMGVAIENLLKGVLRAKDWKFREVIAKGHELKTLYETCCEICELRQYDDELQVLEKLEHFVKWVGKYNLPTKNLDDIVKRWGLLGIGSREGPIITLPMLKSEKASINAVYERFLHYLTMGYTRYNFQK
jgi:hypothetical protein